MADIWYFAYGSNLNLGQMEKRAGSVEDMLKAKLPNFRLVFRGYSDAWGGAMADIEPYEGSTVYGVVYKISEEQLVELDRYDCCPSVYRHIDVNVAVEEIGMMRVITYYTSHTVTNVNSLWISSNTVIIWKSSNLPVSESP